MKLIIGLGNIGEKYEGTRHNVGFMILNHFLQEAKTVRTTAWETNNRLKSDIATLDWQPKHSDPQSLVLAKPRTFMNESGTAVKLIRDFYKIDFEDIWVVYDELDLPLGVMKIRFGGAAAGHHGVEDIMEKIGTDKFWRFRMGIGGSKQHIDHNADTGDGRKKTVARNFVHDAADHVLGTFSRSEESEVKKLLKNGEEALEVALEKGIETAQNRFNTK